MSKLKVPGGCVVPVPPHWVKVCPPIVTWVTLPTVSGTDRTIVLPVNDGTVVATVVARAGLLVKVMGASTAEPIALPVEIDRAIGAPTARSGAWVVGRLLPEMMIVMRPL